MYLDAAMVSPPCLFFVPALLLFRVSTFSSFLSILLPPFSPNDFQRWESSLLSRSVHSNRLPRRFVLPSRIVHME